MARPDDLIDFPDLDEVIATYKEGDFLDNRDFHSVVTVQFGELIHDGLVDWNDPAWQWDKYSDEQFARLNQKIERRFWYREISCLPLKRWNLEFIRKMNEIMPKYRILYDIQAKDPDWLLAYHAWGTHNQDTVDLGTKDVQEKQQHATDKTGEHQTDTTGESHEVAVTDKDEWGKSRDVGSEFPQTLLSGNSDYASDGEDREYEDLGKQTVTTDGTTKGHEDGTTKGHEQGTVDGTTSQQTRDTQDLAYQYEDFREGDYLQKYDDIMNKWRDVDLAILNELDCLFSHLLTVNFNYL